MRATYELVAERISITSGTPVEKLRPDMTLQQLALDSFLMVEMAIDLQEEFDAIFSQEALQRVETVADLVDLVNASQVEPLGARSAQASAPDSSSPAGATRG
jgi:acyl carrier protein